MTKKCLITDSLIQQCYDNLLLGMSQTSCAKSIGIANSTWFLWQKLALEGKAPYTRWWTECQRAEADLQANCLKSVKLAMDHGDSKAAMFLLQTKFASEGFGKQSQVSMTSENVNLNYKTKSNEKTAEQIRADILQKLNRKSFSPERAYIPLNTQD
jgi:hypothetical protein